RRASGWASAPARRRRRLSRGRRRGVAGADRPRGPAPRRVRPRRRHGGERGVASVTVTSPPPRERARETPPPAPGRAPTLLDSFNYAFEGIIHVLRTQRNLRIHFVIAIVGIGAAAALGVGRDDLILLLIAIAFVLVAEMVNSAIEGALDVSTTSFDPNAKLAKDIAAGAVLISAITAIAVGYLIFAHAAAHRTARLLDRVRDAPAEVTLISLVLVILVVIGTKAWTGRGTPLRGGGGGERVRAVLAVPRRRFRADGGRARVRRRQRRERGLPARRLRREDCDRGGGERRCAPGRARRDRDHRVAVRRLPPVAARV